MSEFAIRCLKELARIEEVEVCKQEEELKEKTKLASFKLAAISMITKGPTIEVRHDRITDLWRAIRILEKHS